MPAGRYGPFLDPLGCPAAALTRRAAATSLYDRTLSYRGKLDLLGRLLDVHGRTQGLKIKCAGFLRAISVTAMDAKDFEPSKK